MENNLIDIKPYAKPKKGGTGNSHITYNITGTDIGSDLSLRSLTANRILAEYIEANNFKGGAANFVYLVASDGSISTLRGDNLTYNSGRIDDFQSNNITTQKINVDDTATINNIYNNYLNTKEIVTDFLTVNKGAHFFEVVIDKIKSVGGTIINTATSCILDYVEPYYGDGLSAPMTGYKCYWKQTDDDERYVSNDWKVGDQAISQNCNLVAGVNHNTSNHYYWRVVSEVGNTTKYVNFDTGQVSDGVLVDGEYVAPDYKIEFNDDFLYDNLQQGDYHITIDEWTTNNTPDSWIDNTLTVKDTLHGLNLFPKEIVDINTGDPETNVTRMAWMSKGMFSFSTTKMTKLNVLFLFDDDTVEYHPIESIIAEMESHQGEADYANLNIKDGATDWYRFEIKAVTNAVVKQILITSDVVEVFHACHWIVLSDKQGEVDVPTQGTDFEIETRGWDNVPAKGDNIAQLGYRYGQNPTADDISRASAIIIASYKTPDSGGTINGRTIQPIKPPSYAQYQNITDFNLFTHRGTWMDSTGCYIKGNLVSESGDIINIDDQLSVDVDYYGLICSESPVTKPTTGSKTIRFTVLHVYNGAGTIMTNSELNGWCIIVNNGNEITASSGYFSYTVTSLSASSLDVKLYSADDVMKDNIVVSVINLEDVTDGKDGAYNQWAYKNNEITPSTPTSNSTFPPSGWTAQPSQPSDGEYTWMTTRTVTPSNANPYGPWSTPIRITGEDGQPGTDGNTFEYVYCRTQNRITDISSFGYVNYQSVDRYGTYAYQPDYQPTTSADNYSYWNWTDNPQGIDGASYNYEYVMSREWSKNNTYDNYRSYWSVFSTPVIWSKWGEKGMDGDGVEYIFKLYTQSTLPSSAYPTYADYGEKTFTDDDFVPSSWDDDPLSPTSNRSYCFVSQRRQKNGQWILPTDSVEGTPWSTPTIWARWSKDGTDGTNGTDGTDGTDGENGVVDKLVPYTTLFEVRTTSTDDYSDIVSKLYANLQYQVWHADGDVVSQVTGTALNSYSIRGTVRAANRDILIYNLVTATGQDGFAINQNMFKLYDGSNYYMTNMLDHLGYSPSAVYHDYRKLSQSSTLAGNYLPIEIQVELLYNNQVVDSKVHEVIFKAGHVFEVTDAALNSAFFGSWTKDGVTINGMSQIHQDMQGISTNVSTLSNNLGTLQSDYSSFKETATQFQTQVNSYYFNSSYQPIFTWSEINQTASDISFSVQSDIEGKLIKTGININNNVISLDSANTTIGGDVYIHKGNLLSDGIDKETGGMVRTESTVSTTSGSKSTTPVEFKTFVAGDVFRVSDLFVEYYNTKTGVFSEEHITTGCTFYIKKGTGTAQSITTSTSITFTSSTAGTYSFYATYNNLPADCILYGFMDYTSTASSVTEIASNGINIADNNDYMRFDTSAQKFYVETRYQKGNADERGMSMKIDNGPIMTRLLNQEPGSIISGGSYPNDLNHPTYSTLAATSSGNIGWGTTNAQLSIARYINTNTANTVYIHSDVDVYIFTENTVNTTFYIGGVHNDTSKGLVNGRQIWIKGHPKLTVDPTNYDNYPNEAHTIMLKSQYWNNTSVGSKTMSSSNGYSWHLVYYYGTWIEI